MKFKYFTLISAFVLAGCVGRTGNSNTNSTESAETQNTITADSTTTQPNNEDDATILGRVAGDFNGDGKQESATLYYSNKLKADAEDTADYYSYIHKSEILFDDSTIAPISSEWCLTDLTDEGDLNGDGRCEIGVRVGGGHSNWGSYTVYTFTNEGWKELITIPHYAFQSSPYQDLVRIDPNDKNHLIVKEVNIDDFNEYDVRIPINN
jgi:hypothetical protein